LNKKNNTNEEINSEKSFGILFAVISFLTAAFLVYKGNAFYIWFLLIALMLLLLAFILPNTLKKPNLIWNKFGVLLGSIVSPMVMLFIFILTIIPTGVIRRILGKDSLKKEMELDKKSYWVERKEPISNMKKQF
jgi:hypothetical protein